jgi:hypothetical protein
MARGKYWGGHYPYGSEYELKRFLDSNRRMMRRHDQASPYARYDERKGNDPNYTDDIIKTRKHNQHPTTVLLLSKGRRKR